MRKYPPFAFCLGACTQTSSLLVTVSTVTMLTPTDTPTSKVGATTSFFFYPRQEFKNYKSRRPLMG